MLYNNIKLSFMLLPLIEVASQFEINRGRKTVYRLCHLTEKMFGGPSFSLVWTRQQTSVLLYI